MVGLIWDLGDFGFVVTRPWTNIGKSKMGTS